VPGGKRARSRCLKRVTLSPPLQRRNMVVGRSKACISPKEPFAHRLGGKRDEVAGRVPLGVHALVRLRKGLKVVGPCIAIIVVR